nr:DUF4129 domain-containing protein [Halovivax sp. KZCA124]
MLMERNNGATIVIALFSLVVLALTAASLPLQPLSDGEGTSEITEEPNSTTPDSIDGRGDGQNLLSLIPILFLILLSLIGVLVAIVGYRTLVRSAHSEATTTTTSLATETESLDTPLEDVATVAGTTADRIQRTDSFENEIYRAWKEMIQTLSVSNPQTKTSGEFADAAIRAGMDEQDVSELTQLFDRVRYGNWEPTAEDEQHAIDVLKRIEDSYHSDQS